MTQRIGPASRVLLYSEATPDTDPGGPLGYVLPVDGPDTFFSAAPLAEAPAFMGDANAPSTVPGEITASGSINMGLEFLTVGYLLKALFGSANAPVATAGGQVHYFPLVNPPGSFQIQKEWQDGVLQIVRNRGVYIDSLTLPQTTSGAQKVQMALMGYGDELNTATNAGTADLAGTKTSNGYKATSAFYAEIKRNGVALATAVNFNPKISRKMSRQSAVANAGVAASVNAGLIRCDGVLDTIFDTSINLSNYNDAIAATRMSLEVVWADQQMLTVGNFLYLLIPQVVFERRGPAVGGEMGFTQPQNFKMVYDNGAVASQAPGFLFSSNGPFLIGATTFNLGIKVNGGATVTIALTQGAARTATQVIADIVTAGTLAASANYEVWPATPQGGGGRFRIRTSTLGAGGSIACDTTVANSAHTILGLDATVRAGKAGQSLHAYLFNGQSTQYA